MGGCVSKFKLAIWIACAVIGIAATAEGAAVTLAWNPNTEPGILGYRVSYGTASGAYTTSVDVGNATSHTLTNLFAGQTYYFAVQALNAAGPSPYSNEVSATPTSPLTVTNLTANRTSPQLLGTTITFSATASGGTPPYQYKWWIVSGATQIVGSNWSTNSSFAWLPILANPLYTIRVWARKASSTVDAPDNPAATLEMSFAVTSPGPTNQAPTVNAGADQTITLPSSASLSATVSDDGLPTGTLTRNWTRASGPGTVTFSAPTSATTSASFSVAGTYVLRLTASDGALSGSDDVSIVVSGPPAPGSLVGAWGFNEGVGTALGDSSGNGRTGAVTGATWTTGRYGQALNFDGNDLVTLSDLDLTGSLTVMAWMQTRSLHASGCASLLMKALDYGFEICGGKLIAGVGTGSTWTARPFQTLTSGDLNVWKHVALTYDGTTLRLYIGGTLITSAAGTHVTSDNLLLFGRWNTNAEFWDGLIDEVRIYNRALTAGEIQTDMNTPVGGASAANTAPTVNAGADRSITLPSNTALSATVSDDGKPTPPGALTLSWTRVSGPGTVTFSAPTAAATNASFSVAGTYVLRLTVSDGLLSAADDLTVTVATAANTAPTVNAGADRSLTLPSNTTLSATVSDDGKPTPPGALTLSWTRVSGPGTVTFSAPTAAATNASFSVAGTYVLRLTASDGALSRSDDVAIVVNGPPVSGSLIGAWGFNEGSGAALGDSSGNGRTGAVTGATWTTGRYGQALSFDGNDLVTLSDLDLTGSFTVMAWMQTRSLHANGCASLVMKALDYGFEICQGKLIAGVGTGSTWTARPFQTLTSADLNVWKHVALTYDGTTLRFYVGGTLVTSATGAHGTSNNLLMFGRWNSNAEFWNGLIDEVRIHSRALTQAEVQVEMNTPIGN